MDRRGGADEDTEDPNAFVFVEEWVDETALQAHVAMPHIATFMAAFLSTLAPAPEVQFHTVAGSKSLADVNAR